MAEPEGQTMNGWPSLAEWAKVGEAWPGPEGWRSVAGIGRLEGTTMTEIPGWSSVVVGDTRYWVPAKLSEVEEDIDPGDDLAYWAWTIIANVSQGVWSEQTDEWVGAATRWRDAFHASLDDDRRRRQIDADWSTAREAWPESEDEKGQ